MKFYDPQFTYQAPSQHSNKYEYATRTELYAALNRLKSAITERLKQGGEVEKGVLTEKEETLYKEFVDAFEKDEFVY